MLPAPYNEQATHVKTVHSIPTFICEGFYLKPFAIVFFIFTLCSPHLAHSEISYKALHVPAIPFCGNLKEFNTNNAYWLALASNVAYENHSTVEGFKNNKEYSENVNDLQNVSTVLVQETPDEKNGVMGVNTVVLFVESETELIIAIRGTEPDDPTDYVNDLSTTTVQWDWAGKVHLGFYTYFQSLWLAIEPKLSSVANKNVWITGHSLGAAGATLLHIYLARLQAYGNYPNIKLRPLYTFGSPRIGDDIFAQAINNDISIPPMYRLRNEHDPVTVSPKMSRSNRKTYRHVGQLIYLNDDGEIDLKADEKEIGSNFRDIPIFNYFRSFSSHLLTSYIRKLIRRIPAPTGCEKPSQR
ncbi:MAG: lipase family protein [Bdellovibrionales bacterium]|nr:lipase family protein [Bdellovibrionales bacterium]